MSGGATAIIHEAKEAQSMVREVLRMCNTLYEEVTKLKAENRLLKEMLDAKKK